MEANDLMPSTQKFQIYYDEYIKMIEEKIIEAAKKDQRTIIVRIPPRLKYHIMAALEEAYYECYASDDMHDGVCECVLTIFGEYNIYI